MIGLEECKLLQGIVRPEGAFHWLLLLTCGVVVLSVPSHGLGLGELLEQSLHGTPLGRNLPDGLPERGLLDRLDERGLLDGLLEPGPFDRLLKCGLLGGIAPQLLLASQLVIQALGVALNLVLGLNLALQLVFLQLGALHLGALFGVL